MVTELTPAPMSINATPLFISSGLRTALAVIPGMKNLRAMPICILPKSSSRFVDNLLLPMNTLNFPSILSALIPMISLSGSFMQSSVEKDCATAP